MPLSHYEKQVVLFIKGHFHKYPAITIEHIVAKHYDLYLEQVHEPNVYRMLLSLYEKLVAEGHIRFNLSDFLTDSFKQNRYSDGDGLTIRRTDIMRNIRAELHDIQVY